MILNKAQAEAIYSAMVALNNVSGVVTVRLPLDDGKFADVEQDYFSHRVKVDKWVHGESHGMEFYADQNAFEVAYGLDEESRGYAREQQLIDDANDFRAVER